MPQITTDFNLPDADGRTYKWSITKFPARDGLRLFSKLGQIIGPALTELVDEVSRDEVTGKAKVSLSGDSLGKAVKILVEKMDEDTVIELVERLLSQTRKNDEEILPTFDVEFMGQYGKLLQILQKVLEVNFGDFFGAISGGSFAVDETQVEAAAAVAATPTHLKPVPNPKDDSASTG